MNSTIYPTYPGVFIAVLIGAVLLLSGCNDAAEPTSFSNVSVLAGSEGEFREPFGLAARNGDAFVSDGENGKLFKISAQGVIAEYGAGFDTPSGLAFDEVGNLIVADPGSNTIKLVHASGTVQNLAGIEGQQGESDGESATALFNGPVGVAVGVGSRIFVADTYNDRIRLIANGTVSTVAGSSRGYRDGVGTEAQFDTPLGLAMWDDKLLVADAGNRRIRVIEPDGTVWTLAGTGEVTSRDGPLLDSGFVRPTAIAVDSEGRIYVADGNSIRMIGGRVFPFVETITDTRRGFRDGAVSSARFNRPSGVAVDTGGNLLVADSENRVVRRISGKQKAPESKGTPVPFTAETFRDLQPGRWPYEPPETARDIAGTLGEIRGEMTSENPRVWFHNGLDIAGRYGETAYFIRNEKVLDPFAVDNVGTLRELLRMPTLGYIHLRLGRDKDEKTFNDPRFQFINEKNGTIHGMRVPRGAKFTAGDRIGTLNSMNHVHLIAGPSGSEMNALAALTLPNITDTIAPTIEKVSVFDSEWNQIETPSPDSRIKLAGKFRVVVRAFDRADGNPERRKLGVYQLGYQVFHEDRSIASDLKWMIEFYRMPPNEAVGFVYANGSRSGPTGETIFDYIVTNRLTKDSIGEDFLDTATLQPGNYTVRVFAADIFGNTTSKDIPIEVIR